jgi:predicted acylesterase/phospholipase RssA
MSSSLPGLFMPTIIDDCCYIDGGVLYNYPLAQCLRDHTNKDEILGIKSSYDKDVDNFGNVNVTSETSLLEYVICMTINSMNYIHNSVKIENIQNTVYCFMKDNPLTLDYIKASINNQEMRKKWIQMGEEDAVELLNNLQNKMQNK